MSDHPIRAFLRPGLLALAVLLGFSACWDKDPVGLDTSGLEILLVRGNGQAGEPGSLLPVPLEVRVRKMGKGGGAEEVKVRWEVMDASGATVDPPESLTDSLGLTSAQLRLGPTVGTYQVRARVPGMEAPAAEFSADAILTPVLTEVPAGQVQAGDTVILGGRNFSPDPSRNVVTFSLVRGQVVSASPTELRVEVPACIPSRGVTVRVRIGTLVTSPATMEVVGAGQNLLMDPGQEVILDASAGLACVHLPSVANSRYLVVPHSTGTVGGGVHQFSLVGLTQDDAIPSPEVLGTPSQTVIRSLGPGGIGSGHQLVAQDRWDERVRILEGQILSGGRLPGPVTVPRSLDQGMSPARTPALGEKRQFDVLNSENGFDKVMAEVRYLTDHAVIFLDDEVPPGGFTDMDLVRLAHEFENPIYPTVTQVFGSESDLDENGRVVILLTAAVNRLTEPGSDGFVGGFFFGLDLLKGRDGSNEGEVFYALVPDPLGVEGPTLSRSTVLNTIPAIMAHEFEHMVHFNQRILIKGAEVQDALWLSEALAQMAEDLVGEAFENAHQGDKAYQYRVGNWIRARRYLESPSQVSVLASLPPGTLAERGAGWLLLKHASGRPGHNDLLRTLVASDRTGVENFEQALGRSWGDLLADWAGALYLDGTPLPVRPELEMAGIDLRTALANFDGSYPLRVRTFGGLSFSYGSSLWSSAPDYFIISPPAVGGMALSATGFGGLPPEPALGLQLLVVRLQ